MYVMRDEGGAIVGVFVSMQEGYAEEFIEPGSKELSDFYELLKGGQE